MPNRRQRDFPDQRGSQIDGMVSPSDLHDAVGNLPGEELRDAASPIRGDRYGSGDAATGRRQAADRGCPALSAKARRSPRPCQDAFR